MRVGIATDHGGFGLKEDLVARLRAAGYDVVDFGADELNPDDDYPDFVIPLAQAVAGDDAALAARALQIDALTREDRYPSGPCVPAVSRAFTAFERRDFSAAIDALQPIAGELERLGGSRAQLDLVEFTLVKAYLRADRLDDARRMLSARRPGLSGIPVDGLASVH